LCFDSASGGRAFHPDRGAHQSVAGHVLLPKNGERSAKQTRVDDWRGGAGSSHLSSAVESLHLQCGILRVCVQVRAATECGKTGASPKPMGSRKAAGPGYSTALLPVGGFAQSSVLLRGSDGDGGGFGK